MNRALLVGINKYPRHLQGPLIEFERLSGCVNDAKAMAQFIRTRCGFAPSEIRLLTDGQATKATILRSLRWLVNRARPGGRLLFFFSGHGAPYPRVQPRSRVHHDTICPVDFDWTRKHSIIDLDFKTLFERIPEGVEFIWITDCCFSGGLAKDLTTARVDGVRYKTVAPPERVASKLRAARKHPQFKRIGMHRIAPALHGALIAAASPTQYSYDVSFRHGHRDRYHGVLTYYLLRAMHAENSGKKPLKSIVAAARRMAITHYQQHPELRGERSVLARPFLAPPQADSARRWTWRRR